MNASLIQTDEEHHWVLIEHRVMQLAFGPGTVRLQTWSLGGSTEVLLRGPFTFRVASNERVLDPEATESMGPMLTVVRRRVQSLTITRDGRLTVELSGSAAIVAGPHPRLAAWELSGGGSLEGMSYRCEPGGVEMWG